MTEALFHTHHGNNRHHKQEAELERPRCVQCATNTKTTLLEEEAVHATQSHVHLAVDEKVHTNNRHRLCEVPTQVTVEPRMQTEEVETRSHAHRITRNHTLAGTRRQLSLEQSQLLHTDITTLAHLDELLVGDAATTKRTVETSENIFRKIHTLGSLGSTTTAHGKQLVKDIGVTVVLAHVIDSQHTLTQRYERQFLDRHETSKIRHTTREHVLTETNNRKRDLGSLSVLR
ncbi:hypothetical protein PPTG_23531 [Phytophthora nicotianae INRA-310]|uniref:Uncharacterized protein n=1 Tax=Phytophthora nicotianae (strain INRA-310) TaxID=761204 RepID=W2PWK9_PHYN3|nr:hypothetical protein PPTG_23531 [Phytophthora nicotianae INRA-310]ETN05031.1 hypothetical protein PPTG_23531 [Phytophthora nicotianae INRA-310]